MGLLLEAPYIVDQSYRSDFLNYRVPPYISIDILPTKSPTRPETPRKKCLSPSVYSPPPHPLHNPPIPPPTPLPHMRTMPRLPKPFPPHPAPPPLRLRRMSLHIPPPDHRVRRTINITPSLFALPDCVQRPADPEHGIRKQAETDGEKIDA